jgi:class 3 adenylate cyclase
MEVATFDGPTRAIQCAFALRDSLRQMNIEIRAGLHTGEIELIGEGVGGVAVHLAARVTAKAGANEVWVTRTVKDLVVGSGFIFSDCGTHELKGIPEAWRLYQVEI